MRPALHFPVCTLALLTCALPATLQAQDGAGFAELRVHASAGVDGNPVQVVERLRPETTVELTERLSLTVGVEAALTQGRDLQREVERTLEESAAGPLLALASCEWPREENRLLGVSDARDYLSVERLYLDAYLPWADVRMGRQAVNWGSAFLVNPTDPFPEVLLLEPWKPRAGVNAVRVTVPVLEDHEVTAVLGSDDAFRNIRAALRGTILLGEADLSLVGAYRQEADGGLVGVNLRGTLEVGYWVEASAHFQEGSDPYEEVAVGLDYSFDVLDALIVAAQYYRNGAGSSTSSPRASAALGAIEPPTCAAGDVFPSTTTTDPFAPFLTGRDYGIANVRLALSPEWSISALWVQNVGDGTAFGVPVVTTYPADWLELSASAQLPVTVWGDGGELDPADEDLKVGLGNGGPTVDFSGLAPAATVILWSRVSF